MVLRLVIYVIAYIFGYDVWILPYFLDDTKSFLEGLTPLIGYHYRDDDKLTVVLRICIFISIVSFIGFLITNPEFTYGNISFNHLEVYGYMVSIYEYILNFGNEKITNLHVISF
jgi:hypothetical protein